VGIGVSGNTLTSRVCKAANVKPDPYLNCANATYGVGATLAPLLVHVSGTAAFPLMSIGSLACAAFLLFVSQYDLIVSKPTEDLEAGLEGAPDMTRCDVPAEADSSSAAPPLSLFVLVGSCIGLEVMFSSQAFAFATDHLHLTPGQAATANSSFYLAFTVMRIAVIPLSLYMPVRTVLLWCCLLQAIGGVVTSHATHHYSVACAGLALIGAGVAPAFGSVLALLAEHSTLSGKAVGTLSVAGSIGATICPALAVWLADPAFIGTAALMYMTVLLVAGQVVGLVGAAQIASSKES